MYYLQYLALTDPSSKFNLVSFTVAEAVPVQNQAAAQKLLQKMIHSTRGGHNSRGRRHRGTGKEEVSQVLTLDEWERRKTGIKTSTAHDFPDLSQDEELAWELQEKFDLEDIQVSFCCIHDIYFMIIMISTTSSISDYIFILYRKSFEPLLGKSSDLLFLVWDFIL